MDIVTDICATCYLCALETFNLLLWSCIIANELRELDDDGFFVDMNFGVGDDHFTWAR